MEPVEKRLAIIVKVYDRKTQEWIQKNYTMQVDTDEIGRLIAGAIPTTTGHSTGSKEAASELKSLSTPLKNQNRFSIQVNFGILNTKTQEIEQGWGNF